MTNGKMILRFEPDTETGMPHLVDPGCLLTASVHADWEAELKGRCNAQSLRGDEVIRFTTKARNLPNEFRLRAEYGVCNRMPSYVLEPVESAQLPTAPWHNRPLEDAPPVRPAGTTSWSAPVEAEAYWPAGFLMAAKKLTKEQQADRMGRLGLQFVIEEIHDLAEITRRSCWFSWYRRTRRSANWPAPAIRRSRGKSSFTTVPWRRSTSACVLWRPRARPGPLSSLLGRRLTLLRSRGRHLIARTDFVPRPILARELRASRLN